MTIKPLLHLLRHFTSTFLAVESIALISLITLFLVPGIFGVQVYYPDMRTLRFAAYHYLGPLIPVLVLPAALLTFFPKDRPGQGLRLILGLRSTFAFCVVVFVHFNLKLWAQLINSARFDAAYSHLDQELGSITLLLEWAGDTMRGPVSFLPHAYHELFVAMFFLSFLIHGTAGQPKVFHHLLGSVAAALWIGGICYSLAPAMGPFVFESSTDPVSTEIQRHMFNFYSKFVQSKGSDYSPAFFVSALAAMPSLHLAHSLVFGYFAFRHTPILGWAYVLPIVYIALNAVALKWHYVIDLPAGAIIAMVSIWLAGRLALPLKADQSAASTHSETNSQLTQSNAALRRTPPPARQFKSSR